MTVSDCFDGLQLDGRLSHFSRCLFHVESFFFNERLQLSMLFHQDLYRNGVGCLNYIIIGSNFEV